MAADLLARVRALSACANDTHVYAIEHVETCDACARLVINTVLEEAAKTCGVVAEFRVSLVAINATNECAAAIRALKGTP